MFRFIKQCDRLLLTATLLILCGSIATIYYIGGIQAILYRHISFISIGIVVMILFALLDYRIFKNSPFMVLLPYALACLLLAFVLAEQKIRGASSWINILSFHFEPSEFAKLALIILLAKYFSQKHIEIRRLRHIVVSGLYASIPLGLTLLQPDLGSALAMGSVWFGSLLFAGINRKQLLAILMLMVIVVTMGWFFALKPYQKARILTFVNPYLDRRGSGYNALQARATAGSGGLWGTVLTTKNTLPVLVPEPYTDFTFAAFAQKFGFVGVVVLLGLYTLLLSRILAIGTRANNNYAKLYCLGLVVIIGVHMIINIGMNIGIMPITGIPLSLMSHGGSHLITIMAGLGLAQSIKIHQG